MKRSPILLLVAVGLAALPPRASGQVYTAAVLYPLTPPPGIQGQAAAFAYPLSAIDQGESNGQTIAMGSVSNGGPSAVFWSTDGIGANLNPTSLGFTNSFIHGTGGTQEVGSAYSSVVSDQAILWNGTDASAVNLNPASSVNSEAYGTSGSQQVGYINSSLFPHASLWNGTAASVVDLNPTQLGLAYSEAYGTNGTQQVGYGIVNAASTNKQAVLWNGTAASAVNLNPTQLGVTSSIAYGTNGVQQVGQGGKDAMLWTGTAASAVDLAPTDLPGITQSVAFSTNGSAQVGWGNLDDALLWHGTAASAINLGSLLPSSFIGAPSEAHSIDAVGDVFGIARDEFGQNYAVEWFPSATWGSPVSGTWTNSPSWTSQVLPASNVAATFNTGSATPYTTMLSGNTACSVLNVGDNVTIQKAGFNLNISGAAIIDGTAAQQASLTLAGAGVSTFRSLNINNGRMDISDNTVIINYGVGYPSAASAIGTYIANGYNGGAWNGVGIVSSTVASLNAAPGNSPKYAVGYADASDPAVAADGFAPGTVEVEPAIIGDANLDGVVDFNDFKLFAASVNGAGTSWDQGNFNYGPGTNFTDFELLAQNFSNSSSLDSADLNTMSQFALNNGYFMTANPSGLGFTLTAIPEPASIVLIGIFGAGFAMRRRRWRV